MKKLIVGLLVAFLMTTGLVALTSSQATAACPYTGCFATSTVLKGPNPKPVTTKRRASFAVTVNGRGTNANPRGTYTIGVVGKRRFSRTISVPPRGVARFTLRRLPKGTYRIAVRYTPYANSPFKGSVSGVKRFTITR